RDLQPRRRRAVSGPRGGVPAAPTPPDGFLDGAGLVVAALGSGAGRLDDRERMAIAVSPVEDLEQHLGRLRAADAVLAVEDEERDAADAIRRRLLLVGADLVGVAVGREHHVG